MTKKTATLVMVFLLLAGFGSGWFARDYALVSASQTASNETVQVTSDAASASGEQTDPDVEEVTNEDMTQTDDEDTDYGATEEEQSPPPVSPGDVFRITYQEQPSYNGNDIFYGAVLDN